MLLAFFNLVLSIFRTVFRSWVFQTFWGWFVLAVFPTLPALGILPIMGLFYMLGLCGKNTPLTRADYDKMVSKWREALHPVHKTLDQRLAEAEAEKVESRTGVICNIADNCLWIVAYLCSLGCGAIIHYLMRHVG